MRSSFFEFHVAMSGVHTAYAGLDVANNNIANSETKGYSRQVLQQKAKDAMSVYNYGMVGTGAEAYGVKQIRNFYLDVKYWRQSSKLGQYSQICTQSSILEATFNGASDTSFNHYINNYFNMLGSLSGDPSNSVYRTTYVESANGLALFFNQTASSLKQQQEDMNAEVKVMVDRINELGQQIQALNRQITTLENTGGTANSLRDARALAIDELSKYVNVSVYEMEVDGIDQFKVFIDGHEFVDHYQLFELECVKRQYKNNPEDAVGLYDVVWKNSGRKFDFSSSTLAGELKGLIDMRDGNNGDVFSGTVTGVAPTTNGYQITLTGINRDDMDENGCINIGGLKIPYSSLTFTGIPATSATFIFPPESGTITIDDVEYQYDNFQITGGIISFDLVPAPATLVNGTMKIGDIELDSTIFAYAAGTVTLTGANTQLNSDMTGLMGGAASINTSNTYRGIPYYQRQLNEFVRTLAIAVNEGTNRYGTQLLTNGGYTSGNGGAGDYFFNYKGNTGAIQYGRITAENFCVSEEILEDVTKLVTSYLANADENDASLLLGLLELKNNSDVFAQGDFNGYMESVITTLAVDHAQAKSFEKNQTDIVSVFNNQRLSVSGVDLDEEGTYIIMYRQVFNTCSRMVNTINEIYDTLIKGLGV